MGSTRGPADHGQGGMEGAILDGTGYQVCSQSHASNFLVCGPIIGGVLKKYLLTLSRRL